MTNLIVTGTSTEVGKTIATACLAALASAAGMKVAVCKPAQTGITDGESGDLDVISRLVPGVTTVEFARYPEPLAPLTAARRSGRPTLTLEGVVEKIRELNAVHDLVLVEGAGGVLVQLGDGGFTVRDIAAELSAPCVIVAAPGLGTLNHTALTVEALHARNIVIAGIILGAWPRNPDLAMQCNRHDLPAVTGENVVGEIPAGVGESEWDNFAQSVTAWFDTQFRRTYLAQRDT
ncbi:ATP-dependent dethiobiotin synthetase BioD [Hoyosella rhizosphaerae]|uniref:ATP-dependent dethiobiotin synthetase BioD n=1 Tax=Hoyosella rhizosphaerae TaxID=1755582 RepID=A0A916UEK3_9ACTN|nr:dethiobiotin synthase [Hoyosella rhizosphaerae]MBN4927886.1 ATP-dependent dethiobiotin synthetase BioD [Hoyosella rhizosphaerae]GGC70726.1 ATP-dependent dethiobiotin synthetase BioD [Hoyosella rhizosphaerae]